MNILEKASLFKNFLKYSVKESNLTQKQVNVLDSHVDLKLCLLISCMNVRWLNS